MAATTRILAKLHITLPSERPTKCSAYRRRPAIDGETTIGATSRWPCHQVIHACVWSSPCKRRVARTAGGCSWLGSSMRSAHSCPDTADSAAAAARPVPRWKGQRGCKQCCQRLARLGQRHARPDIDAAVLSARACARGIRSGAVERTVLIASHHVTSAFDVDIFGVGQQLPERLHPFRVDNLAVLTSNQ